MKWNRKSVKIICNLKMSRHWNSFNFIQRVVVACHGFICWRRNTKKNIVNLSGFEFVNVASSPLMMWMKAFKVSKTQTQAVGWMLPSILFRLYIHGRRLVDRGDRLNLKLCFQHLLTSASVDSNDNDDDSTGSRLQRSKMWMTFVSFETDTRVSESN